MPLPARVKSLDEVDEAFHAEYEEKGGEFVLQVDNPDQLPAVAGLKRNHDRLLAEKKTLSETLESYGGKSPEEITELEQELETLRQSKGGEPTAEEAKRIEERVAAKYEKKYGPVQQENEKLRSHLHRTLVDRELDEALDEVGVAAKHKKVLRSYMKERGPKVIEDGDEFRGVFSTDVNGIPGDHSITDFVGEWAKTDEATEYIQPTGKGGSGAAPNSRGGGQGGRTTTVSRNDPMSWGQNAEKIASGEAVVSE